jgi:hypothetical protein
MTTTSDNSFEETMLEMLDVQRPFRPQITYIRDGDCVEFVAAPDDYYAERVDGLVTVLYSRNSGEVIGAIIKGVKKFCERVEKELPGFGVEIEAGKVKLGLLLLAQLWMSPHKPKDVPVFIYRKLIRVAHAVGAEADLAGAL